MAGLRSRLSNALKALQGISAYVDNSTMHNASQGTPEEAQKKIREAMGGQLQPIPNTQLEWFLADLQTAARLADTGDLSRIGQLWRAMRRDGMLYGLLKTRTSGLVALPKRWRGDQKQIDALKDENGTRSVFDEMFPPNEVAQLAADAIVCGVGIAEMVPVVGRDYPVMVRLDPEFLTYRWDQSCWYYQSVLGQIRIDPGNGRWILHTQGSRIAPWQAGVWNALGRAFITKEHSLLNRANFAAKLANPARAIQAPKAATEIQRSGFLASVVKWGINSVFELPPGWEIKLIESNGRGWEVFEAEIQTADQELMVALAGQVVTTTGGSGFANAGIHATIAADLIKETADSLAYTLNTQGIPPWVIREFGEEALENCARLEWDIAPPIDRMQEAQSIQQFSNSLTQLTNALRPYELRPDVEELISRFGIPIAAGEKPVEMEEMNPGAQQPGTPGVRKPTSPPSGESKEKQVAKGTPKALMMAA